MSAAATDLPAGTYRFVTWNVDWFGRHRPTRIRTEFLTPHLDGVVAFQELGPKIISELQMLWGDRLILSTDVYDRAHPGWMACGLGTPAGSRVLATGVLSTPPQAPSGACGLGWPCPTVRSSPSCPGTRRTQLVTAAR